MFNFQKKSALAIVIVLCLRSDVYADNRYDNWPGWRGPDATGVAVNGNPPISWSETENVKWKVRMPDSGDGTPIVWGNKILIQTAVRTGEESGEESEPTLVQNVTVPWRFGLLCLDRETGATLWERTAITTIPHEGHHISGSFSSYSPVTDGKHVWANFGSRGCTATTWTATMCGARTSWKCGSIMRSVKEDRSRLPATTS